MHFIEKVFGIFLAATFVLYPVYLPEARAKGKDAPEVAANLFWPRTEQKDSVKLEMFQPQPELFEGNRLRVRAAVSVLPKGEKEPLFGAVWFEARVVTDRDERTVAIQDIQVADIRFPTAPEEKVEKLKAYLTERLTTWKTV
ncbi:MAG: hypothetical protein JRK53_26935, partial [Deltaproteobacteria bacterium]|nr:hypothetical protein [Deltaproteobacteria bacterium]